MFGDDIISVLRYIIQYTERGTAKTMRIMTYDIETYIKNLTARRTGIKIIDYKTV